MAAGLNNLAFFYSNQGKYTEAEPLFKRALAILEKGLGNGASQRGRRPQRPGNSLQAPGLICRGRAALPAGAGDK